MPELPYIWIIWGTITLALLVVSFREMAKELRGNEPSSTAGTRHPIMTELAKLSPRQWDKLGELAQNPRWREEVNSIYANLPNTETLGPKARIRREAQYIELARELPSVNTVGKQLAVFAAFDAIMLERHLGPGVTATLLEPVRNVGVEVN